MASKFNPRKQAAITALLVAKNQGQAAELAKVPQRTLSRWLADPDFRAALARAEGEAISEATRRLAGLAGSAITNLENMLSNAALPAQQSIYVSKIVLDSLLKMRELAGLEERISRLEEVINDEQSPS